MLDDIQLQLKRLQQLNLSIRLSLEGAEHYIPLINGQLDRLRSIGLLEQQLLLGDIIFEARYNSYFGQHDSNRLLQAALGIGHGGFGVILWDSEDYWRFIHFDGPLSTQVVLNFLPFADYASAVKGLLLPHVDPLLRRACGLIQRRRLGSGGAPNGPPGD